MASFFQPGPNDPTIRDCGNTTFDVYCNSALPLDRLLQAWYQKVSLAVGAAAIVLPALLGLALLVRRSWFSRAFGAVRARLRRKQSGPPGLREAPNPVSFESTKSFKIYSAAGSVVDVSDQRAYDLAIFPLSLADAGFDDDRSFGAGTRASFGTGTRASSVTGIACAEATQLAYFDLKEVSDGALLDLEIVSTVDYLVQSCARHNLAGIALRPSTSTPTRQVEQLVQRLHYRGVSVLLLCHHDSDDLDAMSFRYASGVIIENACILPDGQRRDYFQARRLRQMMIKCATERIQKPGFFVGFLELWETRPHPSVVRRAVKLAEHFGAVVEHGSATPSKAKSETSVKDASRTLSGFEYLRRGDVTELQKCWTSDVRGVAVSAAASGAAGVRSLSPRDVDSVLPYASHLLRPQRLPPDLAALQQEHVDVALPPDYLKLAPKRIDFWKYSPDGTPLSVPGCFSVIAEPTAEDYASIVDSQCHLRELHMLHAVKGLEVHKLVGSVRRLVEQAGQQLDCEDLINDFIKGLESQSILIFKGLDTGFRVPDGKGYFWGVSKTRDETDNYKLSVDIYISQAAASDASTALHTWLAHNGIGHAQCLEIEAHLEASNGLAHDSGLPASTRAAIQAATHAETLQLLQQMRAARLSDCWRAPIDAFCRSVLIGQTTKHSSARLYARGLLDGSLAPHDILQARLEQYALQGATELPCLENLVALYELMETIVEDALFFGDREPLNSFTNALIKVLDPGGPSSHNVQMDVNADLFALIYFSILRKAAFEEVYIESTDRCPIFLCPDQAAVFSELWVLGSQCEIFLGLLPRDLGDIIYDRYRKFLEGRPPVAADREGTEIMTMYSTLEASTPPGGSKTAAEEDSTPKPKLSTHESMQLWKTRLTKLGAVSIFSLPAIVDVLMLTFLGRGMFMTAYMDPGHLEAAGYALLISLLLTAGVTGWVGSSGSYYLAHYAYDNMAHFHVQRLSGGFMLTLLVGLGGFIGFTVARSVSVGFVFVAFVIVITTYLNMLGIMATMHQEGSPMTSGRTVLWRTIPFLLISPILSSFVNGWDLAIYLPITYSVILLMLFQYRKLCHEWIGWMNRIPDVGEKDVLAWYESTPDYDDALAEKSDMHSKVAQEAFRGAIASYMKRTREAVSSGLMDDEFVGRVARGMPYVDWLFKKMSPEGNLPDTFSSAWYTQLGEAKKQQQQLSRGLKEHNVLMLFRDARYDLGQNLGLFLIALMDRWVSIIMSARLPQRSIYTDSRARYGLCLCILYFLISVVVLDTTLQKYWSLRYLLSKEKLEDYRHSKDVTDEWEGMRRRKLFAALAELFSKLLVVFGFTTLLLWALVDSPETTLLYFLYILGYTGVLIFQFNRCFTTNVRTHVAIILVSAGVGFIVGCLLHAAPASAGWLYSDVVAQNVAAVLAALGTLLWSWTDWFSPSAKVSVADQSRRKATFWAQRKLDADPDVESKILIHNVQKVAGNHVRYGDGSYLSQKIEQILQRSMNSPNATMRETWWSSQLFQAAMNLWHKQRIEITVVSQEKFYGAGLQSIASFSQRDGDMLCITVGFFKAAELQLPSWQSQLAQMTAESLLYHMARLDDKRAHSQAVQAEHFIHGSAVISKRLEIELSLADAKARERMILRTNAELLRHLCLGLDVDIIWDTLPLSVRKAIVCRITGRDVCISNEYTRWVSAMNLDTETFDFHVRLVLAIFRICEERRTNAMYSYDQNSEKDLLPAAELRPVRILSGASSGFLSRWFRYLTAVLVALVRWIAVISGGGSNIERELAHCLRGVYFRQIIIWAILRLWKLCWLMKGFWVHWILMYRRPAIVSIAQLAQRGARRAVKKNSVVVELPRKTITGFASNAQTGDMVLDVFDGSLREAPEGKAPLFKASYDKRLRLVSKVDEDGTSSTYQYGSDGGRSWPVSKEVVGPSSRMVGFYDKYGRIVHGTTFIGTSGYAFYYYYKAIPRKSSDILRADFKPLDAASGNRLSVFWGKPLRDDTGYYNWSPSEKIHRVVRVVDGKTYVTEIVYDHRRDPKPTTYLEENGAHKSVVAKPPEVFSDEKMLLERPRNLVFDADDLLIHHRLRVVKSMWYFVSKQRSIVPRLTSFTLWSKRVYIPVATWRIRTELWNRWLKGSFDAITACWIDELILREEPLLRKYWSARDNGRLEAARLALDENIDQIVAATELETDVSEVCLLPIRTADLYAMGLSKDANQVTNRPQDCFNDTKDRISVIFNDIGCWPEAPGGVSNCRRDLVNGHSTIRNHVMAECANEFGIPRFQIERNVQSLKLLPLWGLDGKTAHHGLIDNILQSEVDDHIRDTEVQRDIARVFVPLLKTFVKGARTKNYSRASLITYTNVMLSMSKYFEQKDYMRTWNSKQVEEAWVEAWLMPYDDANIIDPSEYFDIERPSLYDFREAIGIYMAYFFIFSVKIPEECPRVFQSTHHGISSLFGIILKYRRGVTFGIWDHAILWRESCLNISPAQCELPISVQSMLLYGIRLASRLSYFHADVVTPCTSLFNPMWETEIGSDRGNICNRNLFSRKIDPIVNGISNMESFAPVDKVRTDKPTAVMLSNVQFIKGIKTAILAADVIVNRYGFKDYRLLVYGAKDRQPSYALEMAKLIVKNNLSENVILAGFGKPKEVLKDAWIFMNSSISEGLPLAIGEAALAGVPIVATEVGATALVMTDPNDAEQRYGEVVAPNDPVALARAQLNILCMVGPWAKFTTDEAGEARALPDELVAEDVEWLSQRMYEKSDDRRKLGLLSREVVLHSFHGNRYLREHEQMYWIQWHTAGMRADSTAGGVTRNYTRFSTPPLLRYTDEELSEDEDDSTPEEVEALGMTLKGKNQEPTEAMRPAPDDLESQVRPRTRRPYTLLEPEFRRSRIPRREVVSTVELPTGGSTAANGFSNWAPG